MIGPAENPAHRKSTILLLRLLLVMATSLLLLPPGYSGQPPLIGMVMSALFVASILVLLPVPAHRVASRSGDFLMVLADTALVAVAIFHVSAGRTELALAFFVTQLMAATGRDLLRIVATSTVVAGCYLFLTHGTNLTEAIALTDSALRVAFLYVSALYYGAAVTRVRDDQDRTARLESQTRELDSFLAVTSATTYSLQLQTVLKSIARKVGQMVGPVRSSIILTRDEGRRCILMASNSRSEVEQQELNLKEHPELKRVLSTRKMLLINDVANEPMMQPAEDEMKEMDFRALLVVPILFDRELLGMLSVRARKLEKLFTENEVKACQVVANASANALKNAILFQQVKEESNQREVTSQVLGNIMDNFPDLIFMADLDGKLTDLNRGGEHLLGVQREGILGLPAGDLFEGGDLPFTGVELLANGGAVSGRQVIVRAFSGEGKPVIAALALLTDMEGKPTGIMGICKDLTELGHSGLEIPQAPLHAAIPPAATALARDINQQIDTLHEAAAQMMGMGDRPIPMLFRESLLEAAARCRTAARRLLQDLATGTRTSGDLEDGAQTRKMERRELVGR